MALDRPFVDRQLAELLQRQLMNTTNAIQRSHLLEGLIRQVYEHVKFETPQGRRPEDAERNGVALVLAAAAKHTYLSRQTNTITGA